MVCTIVPSKIWFTSDIKFGLSLCRCIYLQSSARSNRDNDVFDFFLEFVLSDEKSASGLKV